MDSWQVTLLSCFGRFMSLAQGLGNEIPVDWVFFLLHLVSAYCWSRAALLFLESFALVQLLFCDLHCSRLSTLCSISVDHVHSERISSGGLYLWSPCRIKLGFRYTRWFCSTAAAVGVTIFIGGFHPVCLVKYLSSKDSVYSKTLVTLHGPLSVDFWKAPKRTLQIANPLSIHRYAYR